MYIHVVFCSTSTVLVPSGYHGGTTGWYQWYGTCYQVPNWYGTIPPKYVQNVFLLFSRRVYLLPKARAIAAVAIYYLLVRWTHGRFEEHVPSGRRTVSLLKNANVRVNLRGAIVLVAAPPTVSLFLSSSANFIPTSCEILFCFISSFLASRKIDMPLKMTINALDIHDDGKPQPS